MSQRAGDPESRGRGRVGEPRSRKNSQCIQRESESSSPVRRIPGSPGRSKKAAPSIGEGTVVVAYLREPREQSWGLLLKLDGSGAWLRGIELDSFDSWTRQVARGEPGFLNPSTFFVPLHRVEKLVADLPSGPVPSLAERFEQVTGRPAGEFLTDK